MAAPDSRSGGELVRVLGIIFGLAAVIGGSVGQGILRTPGIVAGAVPDQALILLLWVVGGAIAAITAVAFAELGAAIPHAGGPYIFVRRAFGPSTGIAIGWADWLNTISAQAFMAVVIAEFLHRLGVAATVPQAVLAPAMIALVLGINWMHTRICGSSQSVGSAIKGFFLIGLVLVLFLAPGSAAPKTAVGAASTSMAIGFGAVIVAIRAVQNTYDGWNNCIYFSEEMHSPHDCVPRALFGGIALVTLLYVLVNAAILHVLSPAAMAGSKFAAADALGQVVGDRADMALTIFGVISVAAILNLQVMFSGRIALAMARDRVLPSALTKVSTGGSPRVALLATTLLSAAFAASGTYEQLIALNVALGVLTNLVVTISVLRLRRTEPQLQRPWRSPFYPLPILLSALINVLLLGALIYEDPVHSLLGTGFAIAIGIAYAMAHRQRARAISPAA